MLKYRVKRLIKFNGAGTLKAFCDVIINDVWLLKYVHILADPRGLFVRLPRVQGKDARWYDAVTILDKAERHHFEQSVLQDYHQFDHADDNA